MGAALAMMTDAGRSAMLNPARMVLAKCCTPCHPPLTTTARLCRIKRQLSVLELFTGVVQFVGRFGVIIPVMAIAGSLVIKRANPPAPARCQRTARCLLPVNRHRVAGWRTDLYPCPGAGPVAEYLS